MRSCLVLPVAFALACCGGRAGGALIEEVREGIMGTRVSIKAWVPRGEGRELAARDGIRDAFDAALEVQRRMSPCEPDSTVSVLNDSAGGAALAVDPMTWEVLVGSVSVSRLTDGAFDPTWAALDGLWDFGAEDPAPPPAEMVQARLALVDWHGLELDGSARTARLARPGMRVGLGGSAKGYALDLMAAALRAHGITDFVCDAGGDLVVAGRKGDRPWTVGLRHPRKAGGVLATYEVPGDTVIVTSGDYERAFFSKGKRYHHILDPRTGFPAGGTMSVTVMGGTGLFADALATGLFVMGARSGLPLIRELHGVEALIIDSTGKASGSVGIHEIHSFLPILSHHICSGKSCN